MNSPPTTPPPVRQSRAGSLLLLLLLLLALAAAGLLGWTRWQARQLQADALLASQRQAQEARIDALRSAQRAQAQRLLQAEATNRVLRDELLGIGQRAALLEDSLSRLADPDHDPAQALRLDEIELLLSIGQQRLQLHQDVDGARRALALAAPLLAGLNDPAYLNLRQVLVQEQAALEALGADPRIRAQAALTQLDQGLRQARPAVEGGDSRAAWYRRLLDRIVRAQPTASSGLRERADREAAQAALQIELSLARAAIERRDSDALASALARIDTWQARLLAGSAALPAQQRRIAQLNALPLQVEAALAGSTLQQLRALRGR